MHVTVGGGIVRGAGLHRLNLFRPMQSLKRLGWACAGFSRIVANEPETAFVDMVEIQRAESDSHRTCVGG